ncbi:MAG TPA: amino acid adenylation domain-containing protein [Pyrinomonadaceae bacterium]
MNDLEKRIAELSPEKREILMMRLKKQAAPGSESGAIVRRPNQDRAQLSFAQQRLWFLDQLEPNNPFYNVPIAAQLNGPLDVQALSLSCQEMIRVHETLRTSFETVDGQPEQIILPPYVPSLSIVDLQDLDPTKRNAEAQRVGHTEARRPFDLEHDELFRITVVHLDELEHLLVVTLHHIISDGWSKGILLSDLALAYEAFVLGKPSPLAELPIQYADYAEWQREWLQGEQLAEELAYWRKQLSGATSILELPADHPRPVTRSYQGKRLHFTLSPELTAGLKELSRNEGVTLFMVLVAGFQTLLQRYTQQTEVSIGTPVAGRTRRETEGLIGFFVNMLVLRTEFSDEPSFVELLKRVRQVCLGAYAHQEVPFEKLVEELEVERSLSHTPLFQVMFVFENNPTPNYSLSDLQLNQVGVDTGSAIFDLSLYMGEGPQGLDGAWEYSEDLFEEETVQRMVGQFERLLAAVVKEPEERVSRLKLLSAAEREELVEKWNDTAVSYGPERTVVSEFEQQVVERGEAIAVVCGGEEVSYAELNRRANQIGRYLQRKGVGAETIVGVCLERSVEMVAVLLGILKAGGAYLPLDPEYPVERLRYMVADAGVQLVLSEELQISDFRFQIDPQRENNLKAVEWVAIAEEREAISAERTENLKTEIDEANLAYVIYTSGSTGQPKGVLIEHGNLSNFLATMAERPGLTASDVLVGVTTLSFDIAGLELWLPLWTGGRLVLAERWQTRDAEALLELLAQQQATVMQATPVTWRMMLESGWQESQELKVLCGGEGMSRELGQALVKRGGAVWNMYGPTETTIWSMTQELRAGAEAEWGTGPVVTIGKPIGNTQVYVLDEEGEVVPVGVVGELYIGGAGVGRGYQGRAEQTAERFVPDGVSGRRGGRLYRTGDQVRYRRNGVLEYLGRADEQVKVRGYRIELGEIEGRLREHEDVKECVVVRVGAGEQGRLVGYVEVSVAAGEGIMEELRRHLEERLPGYMVPDLLMKVAELPLTANGKVNRRALPAPEWRVEGVEWEGTRTASEEVVAGVWSQVLGVTGLGRGANFFTVGGHSLLATQVMARLREIFAVELPLRTIFEHPTIASLAAHIDEARLKESRYSDNAILPVSREQAVPLSFAQQRLWFIDRLEPNNSAYNIYAAAGLNGELNVAALERSINEVVRRHEVLRTTFAVIDEQPVQIVHDEFTRALPLIDLTALEETALEFEVQRLAREAAARPFDLNLGPLFRAFLIRRQPEQHAIVFTMHHAISDEWSLDVLIEEVARLYEAYSQGQPSPLPELSIQYADYAAWQRRRLSGDLLEKQLEYWKQQLSDAPPVLELQTDHPRPPIQSFRGSHESLTFSSDLSQALKDLGEAQGVTLFMLLVAAFQTLLFRYTQQTRINVGTPIAGRTRMETEALIGFFVNNLVLSTDFTGDPNFTTLLERVREVCLGAYEHQDVPFEKLVEHLDVKRSLSDTPLYRVVFAMQRAGAIEFQSAGLSLSAFTVEDQTAKFDLTMNVFEGEDSLTADLNYSTELFEPETIKRMLRHFEQLLSDIVVHPEQRVGSLTLLANAELEDVVIRWNQTQANYPEQFTLHQLFEQQVERTPDAVAIISEQDNLTYRELNTRANQLARHLQSLGVSPEMLIAICAPRSIEMVVGLFAILKAGCAYVPLDPDYPSDRLAYMMEDSGASVLLTQSGMESKLPANEATLVYLDRDSSDWTSQSVKNLDSFTDPNSVAYVIYTSGSTGRPKGVLGLHRGAVNRLAWMWRHYPFKAGDVCCNKTSLNFGDSVWEIFGPLLQGVPIVLIPGEVVQNAPRLAQWLATYKISRIVVVPSLLREILQAYAGPAAGLRKPYLWVTSGEAISLKLAQDFAATMGETLLLNLYGSSEVAADVTYYPLTPETFTLSNVPIGRPISNTRIYILDKQLRPVPIGVAGEVYAGGAGLARGYLNHADLTARMFLPNPFGAGGERLYRTGDLGRYLPDGTIDYLGRVDHQVKVRGYRIELSEVEAALRDHPAVKECVVVADNSIPGDVRLVAYLVSNLASELSVTELRRHLARKLPGYMIPAVFVTLEEMPLTPSGKIARRKLPAPTQERPELESSFVAPQTAVEERLAEIWVQVLQVDRVGIDDNFFEMGGHSLLATQVISRIQVGFGVELALRDFFTAPTIRNLAERVDEATLSSADEDKLDELLDQLDGLDETQAELMIAAGHISVG